MCDRKTPILAIVTLLATLTGAPVVEARRKPPAVRIECSSLEDHYEYCRTYAIGTVRLERQLSKTACRQDQTWGSDGDGSGIWVRSGCRGIFVVERGGGGSHGGRESTITCTSKDYGYAHCDVTVWGRYVRVKRQISDTRCVQGKNWGTDWRGIWVDRGCNAIFAVE